MKKGVMHPLLSWDIIADRMASPLHEKEFQALIELKKRYKWNVNVSAIFKNRYDAIVVTDIEEKICWVNRGFEAMTGYKMAFAKNKKPGFLQGKGTDSDGKRRIRSAIQRRQTVTETLTNYRKDGSEYQCRIEIIPLYNFENTLTHFIALENEV